MLNQQNLKKVYARFHITDNSHQGGKRLRKIEKQL